MPPLYYSDYLQLDKLLSSQKTQSSEKRGSEGECHDETLFIIVHQVYELWFKQILHEVEDLYRIFQAPSIRESKLATCVDRLERIKKIQHVMMGHFDVLETMTPMDFLEFRGLLVPASGFQSVQFRQIEITLGPKTDERSGMDQEFFLGRFNPSDRAHLLELEKRPTLFDLVDAWLSRIPFIDIDANAKAFPFWREYRNAVEKMLKDDEKIIESNKQLTEREKAIQQENLQETRENFKTLFDEKAHDKLVVAKQRRLSQKGTLGALFIFLYRDEAVLQGPSRFLMALVDVDENFTVWRHRHALLAQRMLGTKIGTGGSSGHQYLKAAAEKHRSFTDLFNLSTFLIPRSALPKLSPELRRDLGFHFS